MSLAHPAVILSGSCACGAISYTSSSLPTSLTHCHCITCRRTSGAPFITWAEFEGADITWSSANPSVLKALGASERAERTYCAECGSTISMKDQASPDLISVAAPTIDEESVHGDIPKPKQHIYVGEGKKAGWYDLPNDGLSRHDKYPEEFQKQVDEWEKKAA